MELSQERLEQACSGNALSNRLLAAIEEGLDNQLESWVFMMLIRIDQCIRTAEEGGYYESKNRWIMAYREIERRYGYQQIFSWVANAVLRDPEPITLQQAIGAVAAKLPEDVFDETIHIAHCAAWLIAMGAASKVGKVTPQWMLYGIYPRERKMSLVIVPDEVRSELMEKLQAEGLPEQINNSFTTPPLVEPPLPVISRHNAGYHTFNQPVILGRYTQHDGHLNLKAVNVLNSIQWTLDQDVLNEPEPMPGDCNDPYLLEYSQYLYELLGTKPFWKTWHVDSRGRMYDHGYHIHFQASEYKRASLSFNKWEYLTDA